MSDDTFRYVKFDYSSHLDAIIQRIRSRYPDVWNDFQSGNFGRLLLDTIAWSTASTAFLINRAAAENYIPTMTLRESAVRLGAFSRYKLRGPAPSSVRCNAVLTSPAPADAVISAGTPVKTGDGSLVFEVSKNYTISQGSTTPLSTVATFDPSLSGTGIIQSLVQVTSGQSYVDILDTTINAPDFIQVGQIFKKTPTSSEYLISSIETGPNATSKNRIVLLAPYAEVTETTTASVVDRTITMTQGQTIVEQYITPASQTQSYFIKLARTSVIVDSIYVTVNGVQWNPVDSIYSADATELSYEVSTLPSGFTLVEFGDGTFGSLIPPNATVSVTYRIGGGVVGNIAAGSISSSLVGLITSLSNPVNITVTNPTPGQGGLDAESLEEARANIPAFTGTNGRAVTLTDYRTLASNFSDPNYGQVRYALAYTRTQNDFLERNIVVISAWTTTVGGSLTPVTGSLKQQLSDFLQSKAVATDYVILSDGTVTPLPVSLRFKVLAGFSIQEVTDTVNQALVNIAAQLKPGSGIIYSDLIKSLDSLVGVESLTLSTPSGDLYPATPDQLFSSPDETYRYDLLLQSSSTTENSYSANLPAFPLTAWSFELFLGGIKLEVLPGLVPGTALVSGSNLSTSTVSTVNLLTGSVSLSLTGVPGNLQLRLIPVTGYTREKTTTLYAGYKADGDSQLKRREIRAALRAWVSGFAPGSSLYATKLDGVSASASNVEDVILNISGVNEVTRVSFDTAANTSSRLDLAATEITRFDAIFLNSLAD